MSSLIMNSLLLTIVEITCVLNMNIQQQQNHSGNCECLPPIAKPYDPVCGSDGRTYENPYCLSACSPRIRIQSYGKCNSYTIQQDHDNDYDDNDNRDNIDEDKDHEGNGYGFDGTGNAGIIKNGINIGGNGYGGNGYGGNSFGENGNGGNGYGGDGYQGNGTGGFGYKGYGIKGTSCTCR